MNLRRILALDLGQHTGWATIGDDGTIVSGMKKFERGRVERTGAVWVRFAAWLDEIIHSSDCELVVYEEVMAHAGTMAAHWYGGFWAHLHAATEKNGLACTGVGVKTIKASACKRGDASKQDIVMAMVALGHDPKDDNESDALAILHWAMEKYRT